VAEVVGTAFVAIRALTTQLSGDIKDAVDKGARDVDTSKAGETLGKNLSESTTTSLKKGLSKGVGDATDDASDSNVVKNSGKKLGDKLGDNVRQGFAGKLKGIEKDFDFGSIASSIDKGLSSLDLGKIGTIISIAAPIATQAIQAIGAAVITLVGQLGFLITAAGGAGVALGGVFAGIIPALGLLALAFKADTETLKNFKEEAKGLGDPWKDVAEIFQKELFPALLDSANLINSKLIPSFKEFARGLGPIAGNIARFAAETLSSEKNISSLDTILTNSGTIFDNLGRAAIIALTPILDLFARMTPVAVQFTESLRKMAEHFAAFVALNGDTLSATFQTWYDRLVIVGHILENLAKVIWNVFKVGADASADMFVSLDKLTAKWAEWTGSMEGQNRLKQIFDEAEPVFKEMVGLIGDIIKLIVAPVLQGDSASLVGFIKTIREEWVPSLATLVGILKGATTGSFDSLVDSITRLLKVLADNPEIATGIFNLFGSNIILIAKGLDVLSTVLDSDIGGKLAPVVLQLLFLSKVVSTFKGFEIMAGIADGLFAISFGAEGLTVALTPLGAVLLPVLAVLAALAAVVAGAIIVWKNADTIIEWVKSFWEWTGKLNPILGTFIRVFAIVLAFTNPIAQFVAGIIAIKKAFENWDAIVAVVQNVIDALSNFGSGVLNFIKNLPQLISQIPGALGNLGGMLADAFGNIDFGGIANKIFDFLSTLPGKVADIFGNLAHTIPDTLGGLGTALIDAFISAVQDLPSKIGELATTIFNAIADLFIQVVPKIAPVMGEIIGKIAGFWLGLPFRIIGAIPDLVRAFMSFGPEVISGIARVGASLIEAFVRILISIPGAILGMIPTILSGFARLFEAIPGFLASVIDGLFGFIVGLFARLPGLIIAALAGMGQLFLAAFSAAFDEIKASMPGWMQNILTFFQDLPGMAVDALASLGSSLLGVIESAAGTVADAVSNLVQNAISIMQGLPGDLANAISDLAGALGRVIAGAASDVWNALRSLVSRAADALRDLPGQAASAISGLASELGNAIGSAAGAVASAASGLVSSAINEISKLPGQIWGAVSGLAGDISGALGSAFRRAWNSVIDTLSGWGFDGPFGVHISIPTGWLRLAEGAIINTPTFAQIGEAGAEAVIPLTRPARALSLMQQSGLDQLVVSGSGQPTETDVTVLNIENATFYEKVDLDMVIQALMLKYRAVVAL